jgi:hypothetical protein
MKMVVEGCVIRSYDFAGFLDHFVQGTVTAVRDDFIYFTGEVICRDGVEEKVQFGKRKEMRTVRQGLMFADEKFTRVEVL